MPKRCRLSVAVLLGQAAVVTGCPGEERPAVAHIREVSGIVAVKATDEAEPEPASIGRPLAEGNIVTTAAESTAIVEFDGGNRIDLQENTSLVIRQSGGTAAQFGVFIEGTARASSSGQGVLLAIGTPFGITEIGAGESALELTTDSIRVSMGDVSFVDNDGHALQLGAGEGYTVDIGVITLAAGQPDIVVEPMQFVLLANPKQVQVKRQGNTKWRAPKKRQMLNAGDAVRTRKSAATRIEFPERGAAILKRGTEVTFEDVGNSTAAHRAEYQLKTGGVQISLDRVAKVDTAHTIGVAGLSMKVLPGAKEAAVEVTAGAAGAARVTVRFGRVEVGDTVVEAGSTVTIQNGKVGEPRPLAATQVGLRPKSSAIVYFQGAIPAIEFGWKKEEGVEAYDFQVAKDRTFSKVIFHEKLSSNRIVYDKFSPGKYHWRVKGKGEWLKGVLSIQKGRDQGKQYPRHNFIDDTGEKTVVYYQKTLPAITLRWKEVDGASTYNVKVYADGDFEQARIDKRVSGTTVGLSEGTLAEGKYYWQMVASAADGTDIKLGTMNTLEIAYDNAIIDLQIKIPKHNQRVSSKKLVTRGEVQLGARLTINDKRAALDKKGRFRETITLTRGGNQIVYRTISPDGVERYYIRNVIRR